MNTLEKTIRDIVEKGGFSHLSIISSGSGFHATFSPSSAWGSGHGFASDPVDAALQAIEKAPKRNPKEAKQVQPSAERHTKQVARRTQHGASLVSGAPQASASDTPRNSSINLMDLCK